LRLRWIIKKVLVIEDDPDVRDLLVGILNGEGYDVAWAGDGAEALTALSIAPKPCVILLDLMMPNMNGFQFLEAISQVPSLASIPVVITTATSGNHVAEYPCVKKVLSKPYNIAELLLLIPAISTR
jgi:CheY-like chemotaxis protein